MSLLTQIAGLAGVSKATVSRVINERGNVHPDTVKLVQNAMVQAKYQPSLLRASRTISPENSLRARMLPSYALVGTEIESSLAMLLLRGFEAASKMRSRPAIICSTGDNIFQQGNELLHLIHKRVSGIALVPTASATTPLFHLEAIQAAGIPLVLLHRDVPNTQVPSIILPLEEAGYAAGRAILEKGHKQIGVLTSTRGPSAQLHCRGLIRSMDEAGLTLDETAIQYCTQYCTHSVSLPQLRVSVGRVLDHWLSLPADRRPSAVYVTSDTLAEAFYMHMLDRNLRVPQDLSIVSFGAQDPIGAIASRLSALAVDEEAVGRLAVEALDQIASGQLPPTGRIYKKVALSFVTGETLIPYKPLG